MTTLIASPSPPQPQPQPSLAQAQAEEKPRNGLAGLKYWRYDVVAGLLVSLVSLPLSLGIAIASGAPPICGLISAIIAGLLMPFLGGSYVTISGPAAGLAPVLFATMLALGRGDLAVGYPLLLGVICIVGCVQIVLCKFKAARLSACFPSAVIEGMLASIGLLIIAKELPHFIGHSYKAHDFFGIIAETPSNLGLLNPKAFSLGVFSLALIFVLASMKARWLKAVPPQVVAVVVCIAIGRLIHLDAQYLIKIPDKPFEHGLVTPNFRGLLADHGLWLAVLTGVITLTLIDAVESLATASAIDKVDPWHRRSDPNRVLLAMGISNICSSFVGGLTIIPGGVKSKTCIVGGGRTLWANFYNAIFLLLFLFVATKLINLIPLSTLAAILIYTGYRLCEPRVWRHIAHIGREQLVLFSLTVLVTLCTDLLWGIIVGMAAKLLMNVWFSTAAKAPAGGPASVGGVVLHAMAQIPGQFRNPVSRRETIGDEHHVHFGRPLVCFNSMHVGDALAQIPPEARAVYLHLTDKVSVIDHTSFENLNNFSEEFERSGRGHVELVGLDEMKPLSDHAAAMRLRTSALDQNVEESLGDRRRRTGRFLSSPFGPELSAEALQDFTRPHPADAASTVTLGKGDLSRLGLVPERKYSQHPEGDLTNLGLLQTKPSARAQGDAPLRPDRWL